ADGAAVPVAVLLQLGLQARHLGGRPVRGSILQLLAHVLEHLAAGDFLLRLARERPPVAPARVGGPAAGGPEQGGGPRQRQPPADQLARGGPLGADAEGDGPELLVRGPFGRDGAGPPRPRGTGGRPQAEARRPNDEEAEERKRQREDGSVVHGRSPCRTG